MLNLAYYILNWELHVCVENFFSLFLKFQRDLFVLSYCTLKVLFILSLCYLQTFLCVLTIFLNLPLLNVYQQIAKIILNQFTLLLSWNSLDYFPYELPKESDRINLSTTKLSYHYKIQLSLLHPLAYTLKLTMAIVLSVLLWFTNSNTLLVYSNSFIYKFSFMVRQPILYNEFGDRIKSGKITKKCFWRKHIYLQPYIVYVSSDQYH